MGVIQRIVSVGAVAPQNLINKKSCERERFSMRMCAAAKYSRQGGVVGLYAQRGPHPCSRMPPKSCVHSEASKSIVYNCLEKSWCDSSVCDEYTLLLLAKWLGIHLTRVHGPSSDQSALLEALISRFRF